MRVLVVEDNVALADGVRRGLLAEGFDVDVAHDGLDGDWRAREFPYDVIVLDILLPGRNGFEICRGLRADGIATPILMLTAKDGELDEAEGLDLGADDYVTKPFSFTVLVARVRALLRRTQGDRAPTGSWSATSRSIPCDASARSAAGVSPDPSRVRTARGTRPPAR